MLEKGELFQIATNVKEKLLPEVDEVAVKLDSVDAHQVRFAKNEISVSKNWNETTLSVLIDKNERVTAVEIGFSGKEKIDDILPQLMSYMDKAPKKQNYAPLPEPADQYPTVENFDAKLQKHPEKLVNYTKIALDEAETSTIDYIAGAIRSEVTNNVLITSAGAELHERKSNVYLDVRASAGEQTKGHSSMANAFLSEIDPKETTAKAINYAKRAKNPKDIESGKYTTMFIPDATAALLSNVGTMASAFLVQMGYSFLQDPGEKVAAEKFTLIDDPHSPKGFRSKRFDDEGQPTKQNYIIKNGKVTSYLHNRFTAKSFDQPLTGNAGWIQPQAWQLKLKPGARTQEEMIENIDEGLIVGNVTYLRFQNPMKGTFSAVIRDGVFFVEGGEIQHAVKGLRLSDSFPNILSNVRSIAKKNRPIMHWWLSIPTIAGSIVTEDVKYTRPVK